MKNRLVYICSVLCSALLLLIGNRIAVADLPDFAGVYQDSCEKATVTGILSRQSAAQIVEGVSYGRGVNIIFAAKLLTGENKGALVTAVQNSDPDSPYQMRDVRTGDRILLTVNPDEQAEIRWLMGEYNRSDTLVLLGAAFCLALVLFGGLKGVNTILSLAFTCLAVFAVFIPAILSGLNIYLWSILTCVFITVMTLLIVNGANCKSFCAGVGCLAGVIVAGGLSLLSDRLLRLTGMVDEESLFLKFLREDTVIDLKAIIFAAIILGAVGAIMDVAVSLSSSLLELSEQSRECSRRSLFSSGISIGRDIMGTMANTLVLAYIGSSLSLALLLAAYSSSMLALFNREAIVVEVLQALVGSFGILLTIPLTSAVCAVLYARRRRLFSACAVAAQDPPEQPS
jgi:uncharacterized membrane protein